MVGYDSAVTHIASDHDLQIAADIRMAGRIIAFCGDSFCDPGTESNQSYKSWPDILVDYCGNSALCYGISGWALFHSYIKLLDCLSDKTDYVIFCITESARLPNRWFAPINYSSMLAAETNTGHHHDHHLSSAPKHMRSNIMAAAISYYEYLFYEEYHDFVHKCILEKLDALMLQHKKKCIWFSSFDDSMQGFIPKSGPIGNTPLVKISSTEFDTDKAWWTGEPGLTQDNRKCHMNEKNNINMAKLIIDIINSDDFTPREIKMEEYFEYFDGLVHDRFTWIRDDNWEGEQVINDENSKRLKHDWYDWLGMTRRKGRPDGK